MIDLTEKIALVTGGSRGIGKAIVLQLAQAGAKVYFMGTSAENGAKMDAETKSAGFDCSFVQGDITDHEGCKEIVADIVKQAGKIDILVNNAGITRDTLLMKMSKDHWDDVIDTNLGGVFNMSKAVIRSMMKKKYGRIINISSVVGYTGNPGQINYAASKAGIIGFTKSLAKELASRNITCNAIAPGFIKTDMTDALSDDQKKTLSEQIPMKRLGTAEDVANGVLFFSSSLADYVTATTLHVNGGMF